MSRNASQTLAPMVRKLSVWTELSRADEAAVFAMPFIKRELSAGQYIVWERDTPQTVCLLLSGFAYRRKEASDGRRQIMSFHMKGDVVDLQNSLLGSADHSVQMLSDGTVALIPVEAIRDLAFRHPNVGMAMWYETLVEASVFREWILNIGRRKAPARIAHLLCEFAVRLEFAELGKQGDFTLPVTQDQLADAVSLTPVHVNRTLQKLEADGLIKRTKRDITISNWQALARFGNFDPHYLHMHREKGPVLRLIA